MSTIEATGGDTGGEAKDNVQEGVVQRISSTHNTHQGLQTCSTDNAQEGLVQPNVSADALLQLAQAASGSTIQIPADVLTSLLHSLNSLQTSVIELKRENRRLQQTLNSVEKNVQNLLTYSGVTFALFPKLPLEIQRMIWRHSANIPQIIGVETVEMNGTWHFVPAAANNQQLRVCKEARSEASKTRFPLVRRSPFKDGADSNAPKIFINPITDTLWLSTDNANYDLNALNGRYCFGSGPDQDRLQVNTVAMSCKEWRDGIGGSLVSYMQELSYLKTEQLVLVVGDDSARNASGIVFIKPRATPSSLISPEIFAKSGWANTITWAMIEEEDMEEIKYMQIDRAAERKEYFLKTGLQNENDVDYDDMELEDYSLWTVTSIRYVEATTLTELRKLHG